jgi:hypothetical protein
VIAYIEDGEIAFRPKEADEDDDAPEVENGEAPPMLEAVRG